MNREAVQEKNNRLGLVVVEQQKIQCSTTTSAMADELPSVERLGLLVVVGEKISPTTTTNRTGFETFV